MVKKNTKDYSGHEKMSCKALGHTDRARKSAAFIQSILMAQVPSMCFVTKKRPVGGGQCSKRDWTARLISSAVGLTTNEVLVT